MMLSWDRESDDTDEEVAAVDMVLKLVLGTRNQVEKSSMAINLDACFFSVLVSSVYHLEGDAEDENGVNSSMMILDVWIFKGACAGCWNMSVCLLVPMISLVDEEGIMRKSSWCLALILP